MALWHCCLNYSHHCYLTFKLTIYVNIIQFLHTTKSDLKWKSHPRIYINDSCCKQQTPLFSMTMRRWSRALLPFPSILSPLLVVEQCLQSWPHIFFHSLCLTVAKEEARKKGGPWQRGTKVLWLPSTWSHGITGKILFCLLLHTISIQIFLLACVFILIAF